MTSSRGAAKVKVVVTLVASLEKKDLASFQIANGGERRRVMRVGARSGIEPRTLG